MTGRFPPDPEADDERRTHVPTNPRRAAESGYSRESSVEPEAISDFLHTMMVIAAQFDDVLGQFRDELVVAQNVRGLQRELEAAVDLMESRRPGAQQAEDATMDQLRQHLDVRLDAIDRRLEGQDRHFDTLDNRFVHVDETLQTVNATLKEVQTVIVESRIATAKLETRLDSINDRIATQFWKHSLAVGGVIVAAAGVLVAAVEAIK